MKKIAYLVASTALFLCGSINLTKGQESQQENVENAGFDIERIPVTTVVIGDFPFVKLPTGLEEMNKPLLHKFDVCFFPIAGVMTPVEGRLYKTFVSPVRGEEFSQRYFEKSMEKHLTSIGAVKIFGGEITREEYNRYNKQDPNKGDEGDIGYAGQHITVWALRSEDHGNIYIQYVANNAGGSLNVLQEEALEETSTN